MPNIGEDEDVMVDEDNIIYDVQVDMGDFRMKYSMNWEAFTQHQVENNDVKFGDKSLVLEMVSKVVVEQRRQLHVYQNDKLRVRVKCNGQTPTFKTFNDVNPTKEGGSRSVDKLNKDGSGPVDKHIKGVSGPVDGPIVEHANTYP
ncbi:hypothetical protein Tco_1532494 [Tanacetum coccineum]